MAEEENTPSNRRQIMMIGTAAVMGAILLFALWYFLLRTPYAPAFTGIDSADAVTITQELDRLKTPYEFADDGTTILVPEDQVDVARINILGGELPLKGAVGFELFNQSDMGLTEFAQKINYQRALQGELARTIMALEEVDTARVHLSLPEAGIFEQDRRPAKASVTVATKLGEDIEANVVRGIQQLVASAVPDLQPLNVAVLSAKGELLSEAPIEALITVAETPEQQQRLAYEQDIAARIEDAVRASGLAVPLSVKVTALRSFAGEVGLPAAVGEVPEEGDGGFASDVAARSWPLNVELRLATEPGRLLREKLLGAVRQVEALETVKGDIVSFRIDPSLNQLSPSMPMAPRTAGRNEVVVPSADILPGSLLGQIAAALLVILGLLGVWRWIARNPAPSTPVAREDFTAKLKALLEEERDGNQSA